MARQTKAQKIAAARIQSAVYGYQIPMMLIPKIYKALESAIAHDQPQEELVQIVHSWPGVKESA